MVAPYTAVDLIRVMEHELHHRHEETRRRRAWLRRGDGQGDGNLSQAGTEAGQRRARRSESGSLFSLFSKPAA